MIAIFLLLGAKNLRHRLTCVSIVPCSNPVSQFLKLTGLTRIARMPLHITSLHSDKHDAAATAAGTFYPLNGALDGTYEYALFAVRLGAFSGSSASFVFFRWCWRSSTIGREKST